jgi:hypothetical protein
MSNAHTPASSGSDVTDVTPKDKTSAPAGTPPTEPPSSATKTAPEPGCGCGGNGDATAKAAAKPTPPDGGVPIGKWTRTWELQLPKDADPCAGTTTAHFVQSGADQFSCLDSEAAAPAAASESKPAPAPTPVPAGRREEERKQQIPPWVWVLLALLGLA